MIHWGAEALWQQLEPLLPGLSVEVVARMGSTNTELLERVRRGQRRSDDRPDTRGGQHRHDDTLPCLLVAETQTAGRGRQGKAWVTPPGSALTFSLMLPYAPADWSGLSLAVGLAVAEALDPPAARAAGSAPRIGLKWPNDLLLADAGCVGRKLGGILIETLPLGNERVAVIGIGLNLQPRPAAAPGNEAAALPWGYACAQEFAPGLDAPQALARVAPALVQTLLDFARHGFAPLQPRYAARDLLAGLAVSTTLAEANRGVADGVDAQGTLWLRLDDGSGRRVAVSSGEVSVRRLMAGGAPC
ncbi:biotin--[acetyl-CoA-carboxylase] ligase [Aquabacterium sp. OR-4]|uniref:biotin--[acetyl-CoA-carboxylase] ligase n=1 Tax=Aquabacterium sp. OR-4 TaxID=2978127 RepID=UPI0021B1F882|nr:biotin--[acetyl-CoA-carboxylase] ligase [Aquabacterium sp. OR-4]MDT7834078.1 biotin--[acetyl-CoA-carboxylase] ligase [Aquabacterium sp. OR-4]